MGYDETDVRWAVTKPTTDGRDSAQGAGCDKTDKTRHKGRCWALHWALHVRDCDETDVCWILSRRLPCLERAVSGEEDLPY